MNSTVTSKTDDILLHGSEELITLSAVELFRNVKNIVSRSTFAHLQKGPDYNTSAAHTQEEKRQQQITYGTIVQCANLKKYLVGREDMEKTEREKRTAALREADENHRISRSTMYGPLLPVDVNDLPVVVTHGPIDLVRYFTLIANDISARQPALKFCMITTDYEEEMQKIASQYHVNMNKPLASPQEKSLMVRDAELREKYKTLPNVSKLETA